MGHVVMHVHKLQGRRIWLTQPPRVPPLAGSASMGGVTQDFHIDYFY
jgi:hypothetical protein